jgi:hypothetical protein
MRGEGGESYWIIGGVRWSAHLAKAGRRSEGENELAGRPPAYFFEGDGKTTKPVVVKKINPNYLVALFTVGTPRRT